MSNAAGGVPPLNVQIQITTTGARAAANAMRQVGGASGGMTRGLQQGIISTRTLGDAMRMSASLLKYTVAGAFVNIGKQAIQMQRQFELSFSRIKGLVVVGTGNIEMMKKSVLEMATETTRGPLELADALYYITSAGIKDATVALDVLRASAKAAAAGLGTTNTVADAVTSTLNAYGSANISAAKATDILVATVREGKAEADTFAPALGKVLPVAASFGASFQDVSAAIAALSRGGLSAGTAAIYVRQTLSQLLKPSKQAQEVLKGVGTSAEEIRANVQEKGLFEALSILRDQLGGVENAADFTKVFGNVRALTAVLSLVGPAAEENREIFERMNSATGDLNFAFEAYTQTVDYKFNKALAAQQTALIGVGEALMPLVTGVLEVTTVITKMFSAVVNNPIGKFLVMFVAGAVAAIAVIATMMKTGSALIRLFSNMSITISGNTVMWNANTRQLMLYNGTAAKTAAVTQANNKALAGLTPATGKVASGITKIGTAAAFAGRALGWISVAAAAFAVIYPLISKNEKNVTSLATSFRNLETVLDSAVKTAKSGIIIDVGVNYDVTGRELAIERIGKEIADQQPYIENQLKDVASKGKDIAATYAKSLMTSLFSDRNETDQELITAYLADRLDINPQDIARAIIPNSTGAKVADAIRYAALVSASEAENFYADIFGEVDVSAGIEGLASQLTDAANAPGFENQFAMVVGGTTKAFADAFAQGIEDTGGDIGPLIFTLEELRLGMEKTGASASEQGLAIQTILGQALGSLSGELEIVTGDVSNFADIITNEKNMGAVKEMLESMLPGSDAVKIETVYKQLLATVDGVNTKTAEGTAEATSKVTAFFEKLRVEAKQTGTNLNDVEGDIADISNKFESGLAPAVQTAVDAFDDANKAIKEYERGQRAVMGLSLTQMETQIDFRDALRDVAQSTNEAGGNILGFSEKSDAAKSSIADAAQSLLDMTNAIAATGDMERAAATMSAGMAEIYAAASAQGVAPGDLSTFLESIGFMPDMMLETLKNQAEAMGEQGSEVGTAISNGVARGISAGTPMIQQAVGGASAAVITEFKRIFEIKSPSRVMQDEIGKPLADGVVSGFATNMKSGKSKSMMSKALDNSIMAAFKSGGRKGVSKYFSDFLDKKKAVETPAQDFVKETIGRMKDIIGSLGSYIRSQIDFRRAKADLAKLINMQRGLDDRRKRAAREQQYAETRFGRGGGAEVTGYEQAQLDQLQLEFERVSRDYAMGRATYTDLVDAEIALYEARAAANEINDDVIDSQNNFIDATVDVENQQLELADATVNVLSSYQDVQEAAAELYMNHAELAQVYDALADATGIASGRLMVGTSDLTNLGTSVEKLGGYVSTVGGYVSTMGNDIALTGSKFKTNFDGPEGVFSKIRKVGGNITSLTNSIDAGFTNLAKGLVNPDSQFMKDLKSLGAGVWTAIQVGAQEKLDASPLNFRISVNAVVDKNGNGSVSWVSNFEPPGPAPAGTQGAYVPGYMGAGEGPSRVTTPVPKTTTVKSPAKKVTLPGGYTKALAVGGPLGANIPALVGERGPEMFIPKVSGTIVTNNALERYTRTRSIGAGDNKAEIGNSINVVVNNPVPQAAEDSITRRMKVLANSGLFG